MIRRLRRRDRRHFPKTPPKTPNGGWNCWINPASRYAGFAWLWRRCRTPIRKRANSGVRLPGSGIRVTGRRKPDDGYLRETFTLPRDKARARARDFLDRYPKAAYMSSVESWRELPDGAIEFTMRRLASAD